MVRWVAAAVVAAVIAIVSYGPRFTRTTVTLAALRMLALTTLVAMLLGAPFGSSLPDAPLVLLDRSASWQRADDGSRWRDARDSAHSLAQQAPDDRDILMVGDSLAWVSRGALEQLTPDDSSTRWRDALEVAAARGQAVVFITDGETDGAPDGAPDGATGGVRLPAGSRTLRISGTPRRDAAVAQLSAPVSASAGDTIRVRVTVHVGALSLPASELRLLRDDLGRSPVVRRTLPALDPWTIYVTDLLVPLGALPTVPPARSNGALRTLSAVLAVEGDIEPRNDTLTVRVLQTPQPRIVFVSTAPDVDVREALRVLRGISGVQLQAYLRVAPGQWRVEGPLTRIDEETVAQRARAADVSLVHGDSVWASTQRIAASVLWTPAPPAPPLRAGEITRRTEWFLRDAPPSPQAGVLSALPWDSLTPLLLDPGVAPVETTAPEGSASPTPWLIARAGKTGTATAVVWQEGPRVRVNGSGYSAWMTRGVTGRDAVDALWGAIFDQVSREQVATGSVRRDRDTASVISAASTTSKPESMGPACAAQRVPVHCERTLTEVRASMQREWVPSAPVELPVAPGAPQARVTPMRLVQQTWPFVLLLVALAAEWLLRRRVGFR